jgi:hypothetical protein
MLNFMDLFLKLNKSDFYQKQIHSPDPPQELIPQHHVDKKKALAVKYLQ